MVKNDKGQWVSVKQFKREEALKAKKKNKKKQLPDGPAGLWEGEPADETPSALSRSQYE